MSQSRAVPWLGGLFVALPSLIARYLPMTDLPHHESLVGILAHFTDVTYFPKGLYLFNPGHPNQLFYLFGTLLSCVVPTDIAVRLVVAATQIAILVAGGRLAHYLGASRWSALLLAPMALGWTYFWGLVTNLLGLAVLLALLPDLDRATHKGTWRGALSATGYLVVLYLAHESVMVIGCGAILVFSFAYSLRPQKLVARLFPIVFAIALFFAHLQFQKRYFPPSLEDIGTIYVPIARKLSTLPHPIFGSHDLSVQWVLFGLTAAGFLAFLVERIRYHHTPVPRSLVPFVHRYRFELFALGCFLGFLFSPFTFRGGTLLHERFLAPAFSVFAITSGARSGKVHRISKLLASAVPLGLVLLVWPQFADAHKAYGELDELIPRIEKGTAVLLLEADMGQHARTRIFSMAPAGGRIVAERGGRVSHNFARSPIAPAVFNPEYRWDESDIRMNADTTRLTASDLNRYRYVILHARDPLVHRLAELALTGDAHPIALVGEWSLFESDHLRVAPLSPDGPPPSPNELTFRQRLVNAAKEEAARIGQPLPPLPPVEALSPIP